MGFSNNNGIAVLVWQRSGIGYMYDNIHVYEC